MAEYRWHKVKSGGWAVAGPADELEKAVKDGTPVELPHKGDWARLVTIVSTGKRFVVDGEERCYGYLPTYEGGPGTDPKPAAVVDEQASDREASRKAASNLAWHKAKSGEWSVSGPADELERAAKDGTPVKITGKDGREQAITIVATGKRFERDGEDRCYGYLTKVEPKPEPAQDSSPVIDERAIEREELRKAAQATGVSTLPAPEPILDTRAVEREALRERALAEAEDAKAAERVARAVKRDAERREAAERFQRASNPTTAPPNEAPAQAEQPPSPPQAENLLVEDIAREARDAERSAPSTDRISDAPMHQSAEHAQVRTMARGIWHSENEIAGVTLRSQRRTARALHDAPILPLPSREPVDALRKEAEAGRLEADRLARIAEQIPKMVDLDVEAFCQADFDSVRQEARAAKTKAPWRRQREENAQQATTMRESVAARWGAPEVPSASSTDAEVKAMVDTALAKALDARVKDAKAAADHAQARTLDLEARAKAAGREYLLRTEQAAKAAYARKQVLDQAAKDAETITRTRAERDRLVATMTPEQVAAADKARDAVLAQRRQDRTPTPLSSPAVHAAPVSVSGPAMEMSSA